MKSYCFTMQKGGVGKTSLCVSTAAETAKTGATVIIDADPQGSATEWVGPTNLDYELADVLEKKCTLQQAIVKTGIDNLFLLPTAGVGGELDHYEGGDGNRQPFAFKHLLKELDALGYRYAFIDTNPSWNCLARGAVYAADEVITPVLGDSFAMSGLEIFADNLKELREERETAANYKRIIINAVNRSIPQHIKTIEAIKAGAGALHVYIFPTDSAFRHAQQKHLSIQELKGLKEETRAAISALAADITAA